jgi:hypothetical protein
MGFLRGLIQFRDRWADRSSAAPQFTAAQDHEAST